MEDKKHPEGPRVFCWKIKAQRHQGGLIPRDGAMELPGGCWAADPILWWEFEGMGLEVPFLDLRAPWEGAFPGQEHCGAEGSWEITNAAFLTFPNTSFSVPSASC